VSCRRRASRSWMRGSAASSPTPVPSAPPPAASCAAGTPVAGIRRSRHASWPRPSQPPRPPDGTRRPRAPVRGRAGRAHPRRPQRPASRPRPSSTSPGASRAAASAASSGSPSTRSSPRPALLRELHEPAGRHARRRVPGRLPERGRPASERVVLAVAQPYTNHNGGGLAFDATGRLLIALGDGGSGGDPRATDRGWTPSSGRSCGSTWTPRRPTPSPPTTRSAPPAAPCPRSGPTASATRSASRSTAPAVTSTSATWDRAGSRRSTWVSRRAAAARTTGGT